MTLKIGDKEYVVKFGYNSFCDSDLLDRTADAMGMIQDIEKKQDENEETVTTAETMEKVRKLFVLTRDLLFEGFKKKNFVSTLNEVGDLLDDYLEEDKENHGLISIFGMIAQELLKEGFFGNLLTKTTEAAKAATNLMKKSAMKKT
ncbi:MAG: hypothetical protein IKS98_11515 [Lachnospiraceae bacterium]|nr:hypothetical protein [Lachnospiraceae bacterium]